MSMAKTLLKLRAHVSVAILAALSPLLVAAALFWELFGKLFFISSSPKSIVGEVAVVTGAGHGLGRAIALELAAKGCHVAVVDINMTGAEGTVKQIQEMAKADVSNYLELVQLNRDVVSDLGPVMVLINNAGILLHRNTVNPEPAEVQQMINVNLTAHFWTNMVFLPTMKAMRKGYLLTISSLSGLFPLPYNTTYTTTKAGTTAHMRALRMELALEQLNDIHVCTAMPNFLEANEEVRQLTNEVKISNLYPLISVKQAAQRLVDGMLRGEREILLPGLAALLYRLMIVLPVSWQELALVLTFGPRLKQLCALRN
ncbi:blast:Estradiol 17-beta-dehydrogenase 11 [Drosophila guanche]|uniref:Blast:Estradiol 17-beta-dehydrogenase 11 n=1 Tax=Drosophila guanche TaxID=7266 RepID=A0A3B0KBH8_DROGU|nr:blast:Estradiol 17-beta-dehydrogenase 11 [Drosophila guanche]